MGTKHAGSRSRALCPVTLISHHWDWWLHILTTYFQYTWVDLDDMGNMQRRSDFLKDFRVNWYPLAIMNIKMTYIIKKTMKNTLTVIVSLGGYKQLPNLKVLQESVLISLWPCM